jgi:hypothetical protein
MFCPIKHYFFDEPNSNLPPLDTRRSDLSNHLHQNTPNFQAISNLFIMKVREEFKTNPEQVETSINNWKERCIGWDSWEKENPAKLFTNEEIQRISTIFDHSFTCVERELQNCRESEERVQSTKKKAKSDQNWQICTGSGLFGTAIGVGLEVIGAGSLPSVICGLGTSGLNVLGHFAAKVVVPLVRRSPMLNKIRKGIKKTAVKPCKKQIKYWKRGCSYWLDKNVGQRVSWVGQEVFNKMRSSVVGHAVEHLCNAFLLSRLTGSAK